MFKDRNQEVNPLIESQSGFTLADLDRTIAEFVEMARDSYINGMAAALGPNSPDLFLHACADAWLETKDEEGESKP